MLRMGKGWPCWKWRCGRRDSSKCGRPSAFWPTPTRRRKKRGQQPALLLRRQSLLQMLLEEALDDGGGGNRSESALLHVRQVWQELSAAGSVVWAGGRNVHAGGPSDAESGGDELVIRHGLGTSARTVPIEGEQRHYSQRQRRGRGGGWAMDCQVKASSGGVQRGQRGAGILHRWGECQHNPRMAGSSPQCDEQAGSGIGNNTGSMDRSCAARAQSTHRVGFAGGLRAAGSDLETNEPEARRDR